MSKCIDFHEFLKKKKLELPYNKILSELINQKEIIITKELLKFLHFNKEDEFKDFLTELKLNYKEKNKSIIIVSMFRSAEARNYFFRLEYLLKKYYKFCGLKLS